MIHKEDGNPYAPDSISQKWEGFRDANNPPKIRFHDLRHTCATTMIANGVDPKTVQVRLGHSTTQVTEMYYVKKDTSMGGFTMNHLINYKM